MLLCIKNDILLSLVVLLKKYFFQFSYAFMHKKMADSALRNWGKLPCCIRLSTEVRQQWILCGTYAARFFTVWISFRTLSADCPWEFCGNSMGKAEAA
jgi:hypothetical protein